METNEYREARARKRDELAAMGVNPYAVRTPAREPAAQLQQDFVQAESEAAADTQTVLEGKALAGRVLANRDMGKAAFLDLYDESGRMQVYINRKAVGDPAWEVYKRVDLGDFLWVSGKLQRTRTGEMTLFVEQLEFLTKALSVPPLPRTFTDESGETRTAHVLTDPELRHRKRYLDLMVHPEIRARFAQRSEILRTVRDYLREEGFTEVETPMMHPVAGGARARPFVTHHNALHMNMYLRIAPELYLKRLLVGGFERVFEVNRSFRNEGVDLTHNPEFTMMELYEAYADYHRMMEITERLFVRCAQKMRGEEALRFRWGENDLDLTPPFCRAAYGDLFREHAGIDMHDLEAVRQKAAELEIDPRLDHYTMANEIFEALVEEKLIQPTFVVDYPTAICPLTKAKPDDPKICERFELFINGMEFANAFSELNEPEDQLRRFREQVEEGLRSGDVEAPKEVDFDYVEALEAGMPPAGGLGVGIDRMVMLLTGAHSIREVILFPHLRREHGDHDQLSGARQRLRITAETLLEELQSPELASMQKEAASLKEQLDRLLGELRTPAAPQA